MQPQNNQHIPANPNILPQSEAKTERKNEASSPVDHAPTPSLPEREPSKIETNVQQTQNPSASVVATPSQVSPAATPAPVQHDATIIPTPLVAENKDDIEKTWVDQADTIITTQQNDPYLEEESQEDLSKKYLKARFNIETKKTDKAP